MSNLTLSWQPRVRVGVLNAMLLSKGPRYLMARHARHATICASSSKQARNVKAVDRCGAIREDTCE
jgi:hypothetical protein